MEESARALLHMPLLLFLPLLFVLVNVAVGVYGVYIGGYILSLDESIDVAQVQSINSPPYSPVH
jgi:hypothetical protein